MFTFHLWKSNEYQNKYNTVYPIECEVRGVDSLGEVAFRDHVCAAYKDNKRGNKNFLWADDLPMDCDNSHSDDPDEWITPDGIEDRFGDCNYAITFSRHHMKQKDGKSPRPRFHVHFSIKKIKDVKQYGALKDAIVEEYPFFDDDAKDSARFFFGSRTPDLPIWHEGFTTIDELIEPATVKHESAKAKTKATTPADKTGKIIIEHGKRHGYLIRRIGYYVQTIGDTADDEMIFALLWVDFQQNCENDDHLDYEHIRSHYFNEIEKTRAKFAENKKDPGFFKYARKAWMNEHPGEEFDPDKVGWSEIEAAGHRAKEKNLLFDWRPAKPSDPSEYGDTYEMSETQALELSRKEASALNLVKAGKDDNVRILSIPENYYTILRDDPYLRGKLRYNMLDGRVYAHGFFWGIDDHPVRDVDLFNIRRFVSSVYRIHSKEDILDNIYAVADFNAFHPVREMLNSLEWDGVERIPDLLPRYLGAERNDYTTAVTKLLLYAVIQRVFHPGIKFDTAIIFADQKQGTGKSTLCRLLALKDDWYTDSLDDLNDNKRAFEALRGHIIVELGEMIATRRARDIETIKGYLSRTADDYRTPHAKFTERYPRQAIFIGTSNRSQFLPDDRSGNRRFIPVLCDGNRQKIHPMTNIEEAREYVRQCYAEAMVIGEQEGFPLVLSKEHEDRLKRLQEISAPEDEKVGIIQEWLDSAKPSFVCTRMIYDYALPNNVFCNHMRGNAPEKWELQEIAEIMNTSIEGYVKYMGTDGSKTGAKKYFSAPGRDYGYQRAWVRLEDIPNDTPTNTPTDIYPDEKHIPSVGDLDGFTKVKDDEDIPL